MEPSDLELSVWDENWQNLIPFSEVSDALNLLSNKYKLIALSNGEDEFLRHLAQKRIKFNFDDIISVEEVGAFKPHSGVYRKASLITGYELSEIMMVSANSFDTLGAKSCGMKAVYVNRYELPYEECHEMLKPDLIVKNFTELSNKLTKEEDSYAHRN